MHESMYVNYIFDFQWKYMIISGWEWLSEQVRDTEYEDELTMR